MRDEKVMLFISAPHRQVLIHILLIIVHYKPKN